MLFSSVTFLFLFLPVVLFFYFLTPRNMRNHVLSAASIIFYAWGEPVYLAMMFFVIFTTYLGALLIDLLQTTWARKLALACVILTDLGFLLYFKYFNFFVENINALFNSQIDFIKAILPIGISFYTFKTISYLVDVYRREVSAQRDIYKIVLYIALFPQLLAGPIVKYHDIDKQLETRQESWDDVLHGLKRFIIGLSKKVLIANTLGETVDKIFSQPVPELSICIAWVGAIFYSLQLYFDFSGYSDMAIGLCRVFGFKIPENFNYPYISKSITEFWRRWHISLSTWFKEYLYIPLGGNQVAKYHMYINLTIVFLVTGFWHGAEWTFIVWGCYHGIFIIFEKMTQWNKERTGWQRVIQQIYLLLVATVGWVIFRSDTLAYSWDYMRMMFGFMESSPDIFWLYYIKNWTMITAGVAVLSSFGVFQNIISAFPKSKIYPWVLNSWLLGLFYLSFLFLAASTYNPFIYFRF